jgi:hypothetical protein
MCKPGRAFTRIATRRPKLLVLATLLMSKGKAGVLKAPGERLRVLHIMLLQSIATWSLRPATLDSTQPRQSSRVCSELVQAFRAARTMPSNEAGPTQLTGTDRRAGAATARSFTIKSRPVKTVRAFGSGRSRLLHRVR